MRISTYQNNRDNFPTVLDISTDELSELLLTDNRTPCTLHDCAGKSCQYKHGPAWSPAYIEGQRDTKNVKAITAAVFDIDAVSADQLQTLTTNLEKQSGVIHSTHSHRENNISLRLVLWLSREVAPGEWPTVWNGIIRKFNIPCDPVCKDVARLFFLPTTVADGEFLAGKLPGSEPVNVDEILAETPAVSVPAPSTNNIKQSVALPDDLIALLAKNYPSKGNRRQASLALTGGLIRAGYTVEETTNIVTKVHAMVNGNDGEPEERYKQALRAKERISAGDTATGFTELEKLGVPKRVTDRVFSYVDGFVKERNHRFAESLGVKLPEKQETEEDVRKQIYRASQMPNLGEYVWPELRFFSTGYKSLDDLLGGGIRTRCLNILCGPPGSGKSAWLIDRALYMEQFVPVMYIGSELDCQEVIARSRANILNHPDIGTNDFLFGRVKSDPPKLEKRIHVFDFNTIPQNNIAAFVEDLIRWTMEDYREPPLIIIDYLQDFTRGNEEVRLAVANESKALRTLVQKHDAAMLIASSVGRTFYNPVMIEKLRGANSPEAYLAASKESGDIDFDASFIFFLDLDRESSLARLAVSKARGGRTGFVGLKFDGARSKWSESEEALKALASEDDVSDEALEEIEGLLFEKIRELANQREVFAKTALSQSIGKKRTVVAKVIDSMVKRKLLEKKILPITEVDGRITSKTGLTIPGLVYPDEVVKPKPAENKELSKVVNRFIKPKT